MTAMHATVHVGPDGILRLEMPISGGNRDVTVAVLVNDAPLPRDDSGDVNSDPWAAYRTRLEAAGLRVPAAGSWTARRSLPLRIEHPTASETLVEDRR